MGMLMSRVINNNRYKQNVQGRCSTLNIICKSPKGGGTISHSSSVERVTLQYKNTDVGINLLEEINNLKEEINNLKEKINNLKEKINNFNTKQKINQFSKKKLINSRVAAVDNTTKQCAREKRKTRRGNGKTRRQWKNKGSTCRRRRRRRRRRKKPKKKKVVRRSQGGRGMRSQIRKKRSRGGKRIVRGRRLGKKKKASRGTHRRRTRGRK